MEVSEVDGVADGLVVLRTQLVSKHVRSIRHLELVGVWDHAMLLVQNWLALIAVAGLSVQRRTLDADLAVHVGACQTLREMNVVHLGVVTLGFHASLKGALL